MTDLLKAADVHGFITVEMDTTPEGLSQKYDITFMQLLSIQEDPEAVAACMPEIRSLLENVQWPAASGPSKLVFALGSGPITQSPLKK